MHCEWWDEARALELLPVERDGHWDARFAEESPRGDGELLHGMGATARADLARSHSRERHLPMVPWLPPGQGEPCEQRVAAVAHAQPALRRTDREWGPSGGVAASAVAHRLAPKDLAAELDEEVRDDASVSADSSAGCLPRTRRPLALGVQAHAETVAEAKGGSAILVECREVVCLVRLLDGAVTEADAMAARRRRVNGAFC